MSGGKISKTILLAGRIGGVASERVMQCPHPAAAHIQVKEQIEFAVGGLIAPDRGWRLLASLHSGPEKFFGSSACGPVSAIRDSVTFENLAFAALVAIVAIGSPPRDPASAASACSAPR